MLTGNFGKPGAVYSPSSLVDITAGGKSGAQTPVVGMPLISGLVPCNVIAEEILTDHPARYRAMIVESANPAHSLADSQAHAGGAGGARPRRRHRRGDDRDRPPGRLRAAGVDPVREVGGDVLQLRVPPQRVPPARARADAARRAAARARDPRPAGRGAAAP